jgi:hypothetical protein
MHEFCYTIYCLLARLKQGMRDLMFDWLPKVDLGTLKEDLSKHRLGYLFL